MRVRLGAKSVTLVISACLPVYPHVSSRLSLHGFPWSLILGTFMKIYRKTPNLIKMGELYRAPYIETQVVTGDMKLQYRHCATQRIFKLLSVTCSSTMFRTHCCISIATVVMWTCHSVTLHVHCFSCLWWLPLSKLVQAVVLLTCIQEVHGSILGQDTRAEFIVYSPTVTEE